MLGLRLLLALAVTLLAACSSEDDAGPTATVPTAPPETTTTTFSYAVPEKIDVAYVERVMEALDHLDGEASRRVAQMRRFDEEFFKYYVAIYNPKFFDLVQQGWFELAGMDYKHLRPNPGDPETTVKRLITASPSCIFFEAGRDFSPVLDGPDQPEPPRYIALVPLPSDRNPGGRNPTPWIINFDGNYESGNEPTPEEACTPA